MLVVRARAGGAVLRCGQDGDGRHSGASFGAPCNAPIADFHRFTPTTTEVSRRSVLLRPALALWGERAFAGEETCV